MAVEKKNTFCRICEASCGLEVTLDNGKVLDIKPDNDHIATKGFSCVKGLKQHEMYQSPDRLMYPMMKKGEEQVRVSWSEALEDIGSKTKDILKRFSPDSIAMYVGTAAGFGVLHPMFAQGFMTGIGSKSMFSSATQDCASKFAGSHHVYGFPFTQPFPDLDNTNCLIIVGANPAISKWSFLQVPNPIQRLKSMASKGVDIFIVDPRKTETAKVAGEHVFIRPNTDIFFYLSFLNELNKIGGVDQNRVDTYMTGLEEVLELAKPWTPEKTEEVTHIPADVLKDMVKKYKEADGAALYCSTGVNMGTNGTLCFWIQEVINAVSGNLDRKGGTLVGMGVTDFIKFGKKNGVLLRPDRSRVGDFASVNDTFPGGILSDEILTPGNKQIRALFVTGGNPLITMANSERLKKAFENLELLVCLDIQPSETCSIATHVLPCTDPLQRPDLPFIFPLMLGLQSKPYLQATKAILEPQAEQRDEASIYIDLAKACGVNMFDSKAAQLFIEAARSIHTSLKGKKFKEVPQEMVLNLLLKATGQKGFKKLLKKPHGVERKDHADQAFLGKRVVTEDGKVHLAPPVLLDQSKKLNTDFELELREQSKLKLITKRAVTTHNSWTHNLERFISRDGYTNYLYMHPKDAQSAGLNENDLADVASETAKVRVPIKLLNDLMPGTVALPHGWGHQHSKLSVAKKATGVNVNILAADGPDKLEKVSGMAHLTGIPVDVKPAEGQLADTWSGL
ncbi:MAG: molybdopterin-dependent oxidoreductase [Bacteroidota bacterium]